MLDLLASAESTAGRPLFVHPAGVLAVLLTVLATIFWLSKRPVIGRLFKVVPVLVFCYFVPTALSTFDVIPAKSPLYEWIKTFILPASLLLLTLALDLRGIYHLGPKIVIVLLAGTAGVVIGGPLTLLICHYVLPESMALPPDIWKGMAALSGSWIGGGANFVAIGHAAGVSEKMLATMVIPDVFVANIWMGILLLLSGRQHAIDRRTGADAHAIRELEERMSRFQEQTRRTPALSDLLIILAIGFLGSWIAHVSGDVFPEIGFKLTGTIIGASVWPYIVVTTLGVLLSLTRARNLEGVGASTIGSLFIYLLVACIGASADFATIGEFPGLIIMAGIWISFHIAALLVVGWLLRAPIFFLAVGSQANIGGAASAPIVAAAFHPALAPVGVLLAVAGYVLGTYAGLVCMQLLRLVAGA